MQYDRTPFLTPDNLLGIDRVWGSLWLQDLGCPKLSFLVDTVGLDGRMLLQISRDPELMHEVLARYSISNEEEMVFRSGLRFLDTVLGFDSGSYDRLRKMAEENPGFHALFPFWDTSMLRNHIRQNRLLVDGCELPGCGLLFPDLYHTDCAMSRAGLLDLDTTSEGIRQNFLEMIQTLMEESMEKAKIVGGSSGNIPLSDEVLQDLSNEPLCAIVQKIDSQAQQVNEMIQHELHSLVMSKQAQVERKEKELRLREKIRKAPQVPGHWNLTKDSVQGLHFNLDTMRSDASPDLHEAIERFLDQAWQDGNGDKIIRVENIRNGMLWHHYAAKKQELLHRASQKPDLDFRLPSIQDLWKRDAVATTLFRKGTEALMNLVDTNTINEVFLFHGTREENVNAIVTGGLDPRVGRKANFGHGVYGAEDPALAAQFVGTCWLRVC